MENRTECIFLKLLIPAALVLASAAASASDNERPLIEPDVTPVPVVEDLIDTENFELAGFAGYLTIEDFESSWVFGGKLIYHASDAFFFELGAGFAEAGETSFETLAGDVEVLTDSEREYRFYNLNIGYNLLPGEAFPASGLAFNTNFYLIAGAGATDFAGDARFTVNAGAGYQILLTDAIAVHLELRQHFYRMDVLGSEKTAISTQASAGLSVFF